MNTRVYARGFPGCSAQAVDVERKAARSTFPTVPTILGSNAKIVRVTVNPQIMRSYEQLVRGDIKAVSFDFRERVIREALGAFGTDSLAAWVAELIDLQTVTQGHIDFVNDFLGFALDGCDRKLPPQTWEALIVPQIRTSEPLKIPDHVNSFLGTTEYLGGLVREQRDCSIAYLISQWLSRPTGFTDMTVTLNTLFGDLPFHG